MIEKTQAIKAIPPEKLVEIKKKNRLGVMLIIAGLAEMGLGGVFMLKTMTLTLMVILLSLIGLFMVMTGSHMYSGQYTKAAGEWAVGIISKFRKSDSP